jgi:DNA-binding transcriptional MerR regulator/ubiquinone/menaquinone biosynthesis C-methylase UbiE
MKLPGYYSSGEFAKLAGVSVRTIRYYDKQNILKPSYVNTKGARFYTDSDLVRLQQILLLKYLGFSLEDIREMNVDTADYHIIKNSLDQQLKLVQDKIEQMQLVESAIRDTAAAIEKEHEPDWSQMLNLIHLTGMETSLKRQYEDSRNISARISLHQNYSVNKQGWFPWIYERCAIRSGMNILEIGCGNGAVWTQNLSRLPGDVSIILSDISEGMIRDVRRTIGADDIRFSYATFDCAEIPYPENTFDMVLANHLLFYCDDIPKVCREVHRVLKAGGTFLCSTYGSGHMKEISKLVQDFEPRIQLAADNLYERFGLENGEEILKQYFSDVTLFSYDDRIELDCPQPLIEYILSCHGNQNQYLLNRYKDFKHFVQKATKDGFTITKDAGVFQCRDSFPGFRSF